MKTRETTTMFLSTPMPSTVPLLNRFYQIISKYRQLQKRARFRSDLRRLLKVGPYMIEDIGLNLDEVLHELSNPFWVK